MLLAIGSTGQLRCVDYATPLRPIACCKEGCVIQKTQIYRKLFNKHLPRWLDLKQLHAVLKSGHSNDEVKASHLFSRQFLGIGTASNDSQALANQARAWEKNAKTNLSDRFGLTLSLSRLMGENFGVGYPLATSLTIQWGDSCFPY